MKDQSLDLVLDRYREACAANDMGQWRSLAYLAGFQAQNVGQIDPDSELADDLRTISQLAWQHSVDLYPELYEGEAEYGGLFDSLAGVVLGWFRRAA